MGCHFLLQGIFPTQGLNPGLPLCSQKLYRLSYQGSPNIISEEIKQLNIILHTELHYKKVRHLITSLLQCFGDQMFSY